jgi:hypothetical protein
MRHPLALLLVSALTLPCVAAQPLPSGVRATVQRLGPTEQNFLAAAPYAGEFRLSEVVTYANHEGRLFATFHLPDALAKHVAGGKPAVVTLAGSPHLWSVHRSRSGTLDDKLSLITLTCYAPAEVFPFNRYAISSDGTAVLVSAGQMYGPPATQQTLALGQTGFGQAGQALRVSYRLEADKWQFRRFEVPDLGQLHQQVPALTDRYLLPTLRRLGPAAPAHAIYRVFDQIPASPEATRRVLPLVARLDAADPAARDAAAAQLKAMGRPATLACLRLDATELTPEQRARLGAMLMAEGWVNVGDVEAARTDEAFLASCTEDEDPAVRAAASALLTAVRTTKQFKGK